MVRVLVLDAVPVLLGKGLAVRNPDAVVVLEEDIVRVKRADGRAEIDGRVETVVLALGGAERVAVAVRVLERDAVAVRVGSTPVSKRVRGGPGASKKDSQPVWTVPSEVAPRTLIHANTMATRLIPFSG